MKLVKLFFLSLTILALSSVSFADNVTWTLNNVTFSDGGTATGSFTYNADNNTFANWNIITSANGPFGANYNPGTGGVFTLAFGNPLDTIIFNVGLLQFRITPLSQLTNAGGNIALNLNTAGNGSGGIECFNCSPVRLIVSGDLSAASETPEPGSIALLGTGLLGLGGSLRRKFMA